MLSALRVRPVPPGPALAVAVAGLAFACGGEEPGFGGRGGAPTPAVEAVASEAGTLPLQERLSGVVRAENQVTIFPQVSAPVSAVLARSGQQVQRGQVLVRLDDQALQGQLRQAEANVMLARASALEAQARVRELEAQVTRTRALFDQELVSAVDLETQEARFEAAKASAAQAEARVAQAEATVDERRVRLDEAVVRAPISGQIGVMTAEVGMQVDPGTQLFVMGSLDRLVVEVPLTEGMLAYLGEGMTALVRSSALGAEAVDAQLSRISPFLSEESFSTVGEIDIDNEDGRLQPGMFVTVDVLYGETETATLVPRSALWKDPATGLPGVYRIDGYGSSVQADAAREVDLTDETWPVTFVPVEVRAEGRESLGINGIEPGAWVVTFGQNLFSNTAGAEETLQARVRPVLWERVLGLQSLQRESLLEGFLDKQQRMARELGARPPSNEEYMRRADESKNQETLGTNRPLGGSASPATD